MLLTLLSLLAIPLGYYLFSELKGYLQILRYKKQGIKLVEHYSLPGAFSKMAKVFGSDDPFSEFKKLMREQDPNQPFRVMNFGSKCIVTLISEKAIKDFFAQEAEVSVKENPMKNFKFFGFLFENGKEVQEKRAIFAKIFHYSNILRLMPGIREVIRKHVRKLKQRAEGEGGQIKIDLKKEFSRAVFDDLTACILFGGTENKVLDKFEGMTVMELIRKMVVLFNMYFRNPLKVIPFASQLGLLKEEKELKRLQKALIEIITKEYKKRYNEENLDDTSVLDITVALNKESEKETGKPKFTMEEIASNFELFNFAASDTSFHLSSSTLMYLAQPENEEYQKRIQQQADSELVKTDSYSNEMLNSLEALSNAFREAARLANPASGISREVIKDFKVDGYTVYKGDMLTNSLVNFEPEHFKDPLKFNPDRFNADSSDFKTVPKLKEIPFSHGPRGCIGKYLGEMMVKLIVVEVLKEFEVSVEPGYKMKFGPEPVYTVTNPNLTIKVRRGD